MRIQRTFSKTQENFKTPEEREKKKNEFKTKREKINKRRDQIKQDRLEGLDKTHRKPAPKPVPVPPSKSEVLIGKAKKLAENPKAKKWGAAAIGATAGTLAISGIDKAIEKKKEKKKENEIKSKFSK